MSSLKLPESVPSPAQDSERLREVFRRRKNKNASEIIWILGHRDSKHRKEIKYEYEKLFGQSLIKSLHSELSASAEFKSAVELWLYDAPERDARLAWMALRTMSKKKRIKNHLQAIVEIACASSPHHLMAVRQAYRNLFDCSLEEDIAYNVSQPLRKLLVGLASSYRYDKEVLELNVANSEAAKLREAIERKQLGNDEVVWILSTRNFFQLKETFKSYKQTYDIPIDEDIRSSAKDELGFILRVVVLCIDSPEKHFIEVISSSMVGSKADIPDSVTRVIVSRAEKDLVNIKTEYLNTNKTTLSSALTGDTYYKDFLMALLGEQL
ncbi:annexin D3-like isoform X2 [Malania oleifera]|uniref:annexin D3-like isoform X2 n=1 Tax=Malania oleifera TaxID=397392 RepID=UPI0025ADA04E|nr:annexin D3-like isoform X2 [Malania oleifera]